MKIFDKRPLSLILCVMLGSFVIFSSVDSNIKTMLLVALAALFLLSYLEPIGNLLKRNFGRLIIILAAISMIASYLYFDMWFFAGKRFENQEVTISGTVTYMSTETYLAEIDIEVDNVNEATLSSYKLKAFVNTNDFYNYSIGSKVKIVGTISDFESDSQGFDQKAYYSAQGYSGIIKNITSFEVISSGNIPLSYKISSFRAEIARKIVLCTNTDTGGLLSAVLLGEKTYLSDQTKLDFSRIGISHILALSGMHLAILIIGISKLLSKLNINKKIINIITVILTIAYMALTGFGVSIVRAGLMLIIASLLKLLSRTHDSITSLFISVFLICTSEPFAIYDTSLWLSAFATLGVIVSAEYFSAVVSKPSKFNFIKKSIFISLFAISATLFIAINNFKGISLISPITTLLFSFLIEIYLYLGMLVPILGYIIPIEKIIIPVSDLITKAAAALSDINLIYVSTDFYAVKLLILIFSILFFAFIVFEIKRKKLYLIVVALLFSTILILSTVLTYSTQSKTNFIYTCADNQEQFTITSNNNIAIIDIASYNSSSAYETKARIDEMKLTRINQYIVIKYSDNLLDALEVLMNSYKVDEIMIPPPKNDKELNIYNNISDEIKKHRTTLSVYEMRKLIKIGEFSLFPSYSGVLDETDNKNMFTVYYEDDFYTYVSTPMLSGETKSLALEIIDGSHTIIFGRHGNSKDYKFTYKLDKAKCLVFSGKKISMHPDTYKYYKDIKTYFIPEKVDLIH